MERDEGKRDPSISMQMGEAIVVRLSQVERELRAARRTIALVSLGLVAATALAVVSLATAIWFRGNVDALQTRQIVLSDEQGISRAVVRVQEDNAASLVLQDRNGVGRLRLSVLENGSPGIALSDNRGRARAVLGFLPEQGGTLVFADEEGNTRAVFGVTGNLGASLAFLDGFGVTRASFGIDDNGEPSWLVNQREPADTSASAPGR